MARLYLIKKVLGYTYGGKLIELPIEIHGVQREPITKIEERIFQKINNENVEDPIVRVKFKIETLN